MTDENGQYDNNVDFRWTIVPDPGHVVQLVIFDIDIIDESDFYTTPDQLEVCEPIYDEWALASLLKMTSASLVTSHPHSTAFSVS